MDIAELKESRAKLLQGVDVIVSGADEEGRPLSDDEKASVDSMLGDASKLQAEADTAERKLQLQAAKSSLQASSRQVPATVPATARRSAGKEDRAMLPEVFRQWMLHGTKHANPSPAVYRAADAYRIELGGNRFSFDLRANVKGTNSAGGYTVPQDFGDKIIEAMKYFCPIRDYCTVVTSSDARPLPWPTNDDSGSLAAITAENTAVSATDAVFGQKTLNGYNYKTMISLSQELISDSAFDLEIYLSRALGTRIGRAQESDLLIGSGSGAPTGIVTSATATVASFTTTLQNLLSLYYSVDLAYRKNAVWFMSDTVASQVRGLLDSNNRPLINMDKGFEDGSVESLFGRPVVISNSMLAVGTGAKMIVFGDPTDFIVRDCGTLEVARSDQRYFEYGLVAFLAWMRTDSNWFGPARALACGTHA